MRSIPWRWDRTGSLLRNRSRRVPCGCASWQAPSRDIRISQDKVKEGRRVWLGELMAVAPLAGDAALTTLVLPKASEEPPPIPIKFTLPEAGVVTLVIEDMRATSACAISSARRRFPRAKTPPGGMAATICCAIPQAAAARPLSHSDPVRRTGYLQGARSVAQAPEAALRVQHLQRRQARLANRGQHGLLADHAHAADQHGRRARHAHRRRQAADLHGRVRRRGRTWPAVAARRRHEAWRTALGRRPLDRRTDARGRSRRRRRRRSSLLRRFHLGRRTATDGQDACVAATSRFSNEKLGDDPRKESGSMRRHGWKASTAATRSTSSAELRPTTGCSSVRSCGRTNCWSWTSRKARSPAASRCRIRAASASTLRDDCSRSAASNSFASPRSRAKPETIIADGLDDPRHIAVDAKGNFLHHRPGRLASGEDLLSSGQADRRDRQARGAGRRSLRSAASEQSQRTRGRHPGSGVGCRVRQLSATRFRVDRRMANSCEPSTVPANTAAAACSIRRTAAASTTRAWSSSSTGRPAPIRWSASSHRPDPLLAAHYGPYSPDTPLYPAAQKGRRYFTSCYTHTPTHGDDVAFLWLDGEKQARLVAAVGNAHSWSVLREPEFRSRWPEGTEPEEERPRPEASGRLCLDRCEPRRTSATRRGAVCQSIVPRRHGDERSLVRRLSLRRSERAISRPLSTTRACLVTT